MGARTEEVGFFLLGGESKGVLGCVCVCVGEGVGAGVLWTYIYLQEEYVRTE